MPYRSRKAFETGVREVGALFRAAIGALALLGAPMADVAAAQERQGLAVEFSAGWIGFADDGIVSESLVGAAARWYLLPRFSIGPEISVTSSEGAFTAGGRRQGASRRPRHSWLRREGRVGAPPSTQWINRTSAGAIAGLGGPGQHGD